MQTELPMVRMFRLKLGRRGRRIVLARVEEPETERGGTACGSRLFSWSDGQRSGKSGKVVRCRHGSFSSPLYPMLKQK